jgi:dipeptide transport system ATP-binding protein
MIAMAIACRPTLLIADEPTTALDVTVQKQILDLLLSLQARDGMALVLITHDMGVVAETADRVSVQYRGRTMEQTDVLSLFTAPKSAYTRALLAALPGNARGGRLRTVGEFQA